MSGRRAAPPLSPAELQARIDRLPRVPLAFRPTPLELLPRLTEALGGPRIFIKRDDLTGLAFGGNNTRQLEFVFAEIERLGCDSVVAGAYTQSNWCRQIAAACAKRGLAASLVLVHGVKGPYAQGNLLLDTLLGAEVRIVAEIDHMQHLGPYLREAVAALEAAGRRPYLIDPFDLGVLSLSAVAYVEAFLELDAQLAALGEAADRLYLAATLMTAAGLHVGAAALSRKTRVVAVNPSRWDEPREAVIARIATATAARLGVDLVVTPDQVDNEPNYVGEKYGVVTEAGREALRLVARTEGIILDPVYTAKAMSGLIGHIREGRLGPRDTVVFLHSGGTPAVFAYAEELLNGG
jgi:1-aminocyclopropane-1-carboxylate deaminase/D-cysteine desulfhydrase-like pyridoxal-dependent ACC family enzyme